MIMNERMNEPTPDLTTSPVLLPGENKILYEAFGRQL